LSEINAARCCGGIGSKARSCLHFAFPTGFSRGDFSMPERHDGGCLKYRT